MNKQDLYLSIDSESVEIYREMGETEEPLHIAYWTREEWEEDPEIVVPALIKAIDLYYTNPVKLLQTLGLQEYIL